MLASNIENKRMGCNQEKIFPFTALVLFVVVVFVAKAKRGYNIVVVTGHNI